MTRAARPSEWGDLQAVFRADYRRRRAELPCVAVHYRVSPSESVTGPRGAGIVALVSTVRAGVQLGWRASRRRNLNPQPVASIWSLDAPLGIPAELIFEVDHEPPHMEGDGVIVGERSLNGALCLETADGTAVWPVYNPRRPAMAPPLR
jgi:hypothetical protein